MIVKNSYNRKIIKDYLNTISEDSFIDDIIIPLFNENGYILYRQNIHGPGEHGKDLIFYRHVKLFYDNEFIVVQAKAEKVSAGNINRFADQLVRALKVSFPGIGRSMVHANYVMFINSQVHTNDANFEFHYLTDMKENIKILSRDNVVELILEFNLIPSALKTQIEEYITESISTDQEKTFNEHVRSLVLGGDNLAVNRLLDNELKIETRPLNPDVKGLIINYIFQKWEEDSSWAGTIRPMKWLKYYFDFIQPSQTEKLVQVIEEYISSRPSFDAQSDTSEIVSKITPDQIRVFESKFINIVVEQARNNQFQKHPLLEVKFREFIKSGFIDHSFLDITDKILRTIELRKQIVKNNVEDINALRLEFSELKSELYYFLYPEERE